MYFKYQSELSTKVLTYSQPNIKELKLRTTPFYYLLLVAKRYRLFWIGGFSLLKVWIKSGTRNHGLIPLTAQVLQENVF